MRGGYRRPCLLRPARRLGTQRRRPYPCGMASVKVFVDDAVRGALPGVCARDGVPTGDALESRHEVGNRAGLGIAWLLLLAGPIGWIGLILLSVSKSGRVEELSVQLPMSEPAYQRKRSARRIRDRAVVVLCVTGPVALLLLTAEPTTLTRFALMALAGIAVVAIVVMIAGSVRYDRESVGVTLDASRRWVTLSNVHPRFVSACEAHEAAQPHRT